METLIALIQAHIEHAHFIIFGLLLLAGLNIPVSEDAMLFISGVLARQYPDQLPYLFAAVYLGAYGSDLICYSLGRFVGPKIVHIRFFAKMVPPKRVEKIHAYYESHGIATLILGRFIPFGVRNGLFLCAGLGKMSFIKFALVDLLACTISTVLFFSLYYHYGKAVVVYVMQANILVFIIAAIAGGYLFFHVKQRRRKGKNTC